MDTPESTEPTAETPPEKVMQREVDTAEMAESRKAEVTKLCDAVRDDLKHWKYAYTRMTEWRQFARGLQWPGTDKASLSDADRNYVANITMRHLKQRTASIYAKNPTYEWRRSKKVMHQEWDGTAEHLNMALTLTQKGQDLTGAMARVIQDAMNYKTQANLYRRQGETLAALYEYFIREQIPPTKKMAKKQVLTSLTCGVAYFKQTFQRATEVGTDTLRPISDDMMALARLKTLASDLADEEFNEDDAKMEEMRALIERMESGEEIILREGLVLDYPDSTNIIPDTNLTYLPGFVGCGRVTEQYCMTPEQVKDVFEVDVSKDATQYIENEIEPGTPGETQRGTVRVWEIWDRTTGLVCTVCDGYPDYLVEPAPPPTYTERFFPWFVYAPNAVDDPDDPFPPSDVELMMSQQMEINRAGEAKRQHRHAARPGWVTGANIPEEDRLKLQNRAAHAITVLKSLKPEEDIRAKFQEIPRTNIDPNLYETGSIFTDVLRSVGTQEANLGGTSGATATESSIAESSRQSTLGSAIDELDDLLTEMARAGGQILFQEMDAARVKEIVGPGAVWPEQSRRQMAAEIHLEVVAGSSGRPNQAQEVSVRERMYPLMFQIPGLSHEKLARDAVRVIDDGAQYEDWIDLNALPIIALNGQMQASANRGDMGGGANAPGSPGPQGDGPPAPGQPGASPADADRAQPKSPERPN